MSNLTMIDFAFPVSPPQVQTDIVLVYIGGDTPHVMTDAEMHSQPARFRLPTYVRSNPTGSAQAQSDAKNAIGWLESHNVPKGTTICLDLEIAVNTAYVTAFNNALEVVGYKVMKYGSLDFIFKNPKTSGGTFVADPTGNAHMVTTGDTVATQYKFAGAYDLSLVLPTVPLWDTKPPVNAEPAFTNPVISAEFLVRFSWNAIEGATSGYHFMIVNQATNVPVVNETIMTDNVQATLSKGTYVISVAVHATATHRASRWTTLVFEIKLPIFRTAVRKTTKNRRVGSWVGTSQKCLRLAPSAVQTYSTESDKTPENGDRKLQKILPVLYQNPWDSRLPATRLRSKIKAVGRKGHAPRASGEGGNQSPLLGLKCRAVTGNPASATPLGSPQKSQGKVESHGSQDHGSPFC